jgi:putative addiction module killer protein
MYHVYKTDEFNHWLNQQQVRIKVIIISRMDMMCLGHFGDHKRFDGLVEFRWKNGTRVYACLLKRTNIVVLYGGNKNGQQKDIERAKKIRQKVLAGPYPI